MTKIEQLNRWVEGEPVCPADDNGFPICCPDFSCCVPELFTESRERREEYRRSYVERRVAVAFACRSA